MPGCTAVVENKLNRGAYEDWPDAGLPEPLSHTLLRQDPVLRNRAADSARRITEKQDRSFSLRRSRGCLDSSARSAAESRVRTGGAGASGDRCSHGLRTRAHNVLGSQSIDAELLRSVDIVRIGRSKGWGWLHGESALRPQVEP
jgi:hypothetical protein